MRDLDSELWSLGLTTGEYVKFDGTKFVGDTPSSANIGNSDLTASAATRKFILNGDLSTDYLTIRDGSDTTDILKVQGDDGVIMNKLAIGTSLSASYPVRFANSSNISALLLENSAGSGKALVISTSGASSEGVRVTNSGTSAPKGFYCTMSGNTGSGAKTGFDLDITGTAINNIGLDLSVSGATNNYAIQYTAGDEHIAHSGTHKKILGGALSTDTIDFRDSTNANTILQIRGDEFVRVTKSSFNSPMWIENTIDTVKFCNTDGAIKCERTTTSGNLDFVVKNGTTGGLITLRTSGSGISQYRVGSDTLFTTRDDEMTLFSGSAWLSDGTKVLHFASGTAPTSNTDTDTFLMYSADESAGNACPHFITENDRIVKLYQDVQASLANTPNSGDANTDALITALKNVILNLGLGASS